MTDYISRQAAIDALAEEFYYNDEDYRTAVKAIGGLPFAQRWIPCGVRLPEEEDIYLVTFDRSCLRDDEISVTNALWIDNQWQYDVLESYEHRMPKLVIEPIKELKVIAWMPLPEPYKEGEA